VVCYCSDVGQGAELDGLEAKARAIGASRVVVEDLKLPFVRDFCFPALRAGAVYEGLYLLGTALARPLIAKRQVEWARRTGADALAHGCTGKGNDQVRFELAYLALAPELHVIAPWREWDIVSREDALRYAERHGVPIAQTRDDLYSRDGNLWHLSHEGGPLEDPAAAAPEGMYRLTAAPERQPAKPETVTVGFGGGTPVRLDGRPLDPVALLTTLNRLAGRHGVGRADLVESRLVGMKSRGVYETPGGTVLHAALEDLCRLTLPHDLLRTRAELAPRMAELIYNGLWFSPLRKALQAFVDAALEPASGEVTIELHRGQARVVGRSSARSLYRPDLASFDMTGYDARHAEGFIRLFGLPLETAARRAIETGLGAERAEEEAVAGGADAAPGATEDAWAGTPAGPGAAEAEEEALAGAPEPAPAGAAGSHAPAGTASGAAAPVRAGAPAGAGVAAIAGSRAPEG
jgi:argininosuccinate synthase